MASPDNGGLFQGVRVLDLSRVLSGPYCTALMGDLGADVIKVEAPGTGDDARSLGPFRDGESIYFAILNRGKRSLVLDLKQDRERQLLLRLAAEVDVLVENFRPGVAAHLGADYETLSPANPRLIYASISGFGQDGPLAARPAYDLIVQAASGLMSITGWPDGPPTRAGESVGDLVAGLFTAWGIAAALFARERTGSGTHIDVSMLESLLALQVTAISQLNATGRAPGRVGNRHPVSTPFDTYQASDGLVVLAVANEAGFARFAELIGHPELAADPAFSSDEARTENEPRLRALIEAWSRRLTVDEVVSRATQAGIAASPVLDLKQALAGEQVAYRQTAVIQDHPQLGSLLLVPQPVRFTGCQRQTPAPSPQLGVDSEAVISSLAGA